MAGLKKSEKRLLLLFGVALFVVANLIGEGIFAKRKAKGEAAIAEHKKNISTYEYLLRTRTTWDNRRLWLGRLQPRFVSEEAAATEIENHVARAAAAAGATVDQSKPTEPIVNEEFQFVQVALNVNVSGGAEEVTRFASLLQTREGFYAIPSISFSTDRKDPSILRAALTVARVYSTASDPTPGAPATGIAEAASPASS